MTETIRVSEEFHDVLEAHRRDDETIEETIRRLVGGPHPDALASVIEPDAESADDLREAIERKRRDGRDRRRNLRERYE